MLVLGIPGLYCECQDGFHLQELTLVNNAESVLDLMIAYIYVLFLLLLLLLLLHLQLLLLLPFLTGAFFMETLESLLCMVHKISLKKKVYYNIWSPS